MSTQRLEGRAILVTSICHWSGRDLGGSSAGVWEHMAPLAGIDGAHDCGPTAPPSFQGTPAATSLRMDYRTVSLFQRVWSKIRRGSPPGQALCPRPANPTASFRLALPLIPCLPVLRVSAKPCR